MLSDFQIGHITYNGHTICRYRSADQYAVYNCMGQCLFRSFLLDSCKNYCDGTGEFSPAVRS